jgi:hypothetical protein
MTDDRVKELVKAAEEAVANSVSRLIVALIALGVSPEVGDRAVCTVFGRVLGTYAGAAAAAMQEKSGVPLPEGVKAVLVRVCEVAVQSARAEASSWFN